MLATLLAVSVIALVDIRLASPYIINGSSPPSGTSPSPAVYMCQDQCAANCAPMCTPSCCAGKSESETTANAYSTNRPAWNNEVHNTPAQRQVSTNCATKPEMMIHSIEEGETEECNGEKGFHSPTDDSEDPPGTITIPLPDTLYTPPKPGEGATELPLPAFHIPADILNGKFPKESVKLEPIAAGAPNAVPVTVGGTAGGTANAGQVLTTNIGQTSAAAVPSSSAPPLLSSPPLPPAPPPPPPTPSYPVYPKLPPVTVSEIPKKKVPVVANAVPLVHPPAPLLAKPATLPLQSNVAAPTILKTPYQLPNTAAVHATNVVPPVEAPVVAATKASVACEPACPIKIETGDPNDDAKEYESMVREMKSQFDARFPQLPKKRAKVKNSSKKSKMSKLGKSKKAAKSPKKH